MIRTCDELQELVIHIEQAFLDDPSLALTHAHAAAWFGVDEITCAAVLGKLIEAGIVAKSCEGAYVAWFPRLAATRFRLPNRVAPAAADGGLLDWSMPERPA